MHLAILGATSQIAKDLVIAWSREVKATHELTLFARRPQAVRDWLATLSQPCHAEVKGFEEFGPHQQFDALLNFVGVGNPAQAAAMGASIFDITLQYDGMALDYVRARPKCSYIFLSSGAAYGSGFQSPVDENSRADTPLNALQPSDWYAVAKLHAECRHRAIGHLPIMDVRVFNYFSCTQDLSARFFITDALRAIRDGQTLKTSDSVMVRDYLHPSDFHQLIECLLAAPSNASVDCYSKSPIEKPVLLDALQAHHSLRYEVVPGPAGINATGSKPHYYSLNRRAAQFGYTPRLTSLEGIVLESEKLLSGSGGAPC